MAGATRPVLRRLARRLPGATALAALWFEVRPAVVALPWRVAWFYLRARRAAKRLGDEHAIVSAARPESLAHLLELATGRRRVVEIGTAEGWTAIALAIADRHRRVRTYDPVVYPTRERYLELAGPRVRSRIELLAARGEASADIDGVELLFVDGSHEREETVAAFETWSEALAPGAIVAFHDYGNPEYPGVAEAVQQLGLAGERGVDTFVWRRPGRGEGVA